MSGPLAGFGGKPILGKERPDHHFIGRVVIELYEGSSITSDANGLVMSINPAIGSSLSQGELLQRIAAALPARVAMRRPEGHS